MNMPWKSKDYIGNKFGKWTVLERDGFTRPAKYLCKCDCGNTKSIWIGNLTRGLSTQCTDCQCKSKSSDLVGRKYNHIEILSIEKIDGKVKAKVRCDCGNERYLEPGRIKNGCYISCGKCNLANRKRKHLHRIGKIGETYGMLTIIDSIDEKTFLSKCSCGNEKIVKTHHLQTRFPSCGCYWKNKRIDNAKRYINLKWGDLKVKKFLGMQGKDGKTRAHYLLKCKCGNEIIKEIGDMFAIRS